MGARGKVAACGDLGPGVDGGQDGAARTQRAGDGSHPGLPVVSLPQESGETSFTLGQSGVLAVCRSIAGAWGAAATLRGPKSWHPGPCVFKQEKWSEPTIDCGDDPLVWAVQLPGKVLACARVQKNKTK